MKNQVKPTEKWSLARAAGGRLETSRPRTVSLYNIFTFGLVTMELLVEAFVIAGSLLDEAFGFLYET